MTVLKNLLIAIVSFLALACDHQGLTYGQKLVNLRVEIRQALQETKQTLQETKQREQTIAKNKQKNLRMLEQAQQLVVKARNVFLEASDLCQAEGALEQRLFDPLTKANESSEERLSPSRDNPYSSSTIRTNGPRAVPDIAAPGNPQDM